MTKCGFLELEKLFAGGVEFSFLTDSKDNENEEIINIIKSLSLDFDEKNNRKMFILTNHFFQLPFAEKYNYVNISDANASSKEAIWIEPIFTIPNLQQLSSAQLKVIRINLNK